MQWRNDNVQYGFIAQLLHWAIVALVIAQITLGAQAADLPFGLERLQLLARHKSLGMTVLVLMVLRLGWRLLNPVPPLPDVAPWVRRVAHFTHWSFYALLAAIPISGWILSSASNLSVSWFRIFTLPDLVAADPTLADWAKTTHHVLVAALVAMIALHTAAALVHQLVWRDRLLTRMLPGPRVFRTPTRAP